MKKITLLFLTILSASLFSIVLSCSHKNISNVSLYSSMDLQGHRGARGLKPENTAPAFIEAFKSKMTTLELDTNLTKDNELIVHHDSETNPAICLSSDGKTIESKSIRLFTVDELKRLDCGKLKNKDFNRQVSVSGTKLLTLTEFFILVKELEKEYKHSPLFNIELKYPEKVSREDMELAAMIMVKTIVKAKMTERTTIQSFRIDILPYVKKLNPDVKTSALYSTGYVKGFLMLYAGLSMNQQEIINDAEKAGADIISPHYSYISPEFIKAAHDKGIAVIPWTVNSKKEMLRLMNNGADGMISDYPDLLRSTFDEWKKLNDHKN